MNEFKCEECGKEVKTAKGLERHMNLVHGKKPEKKESSAGTAIDKPLNVDIEPTLSEELLRQIDMHVATANNAVVDTKEAAFSAERTNQAMRKMVASLEDLRVKMKAPFLEAGRKIDSRFSDWMSPLKMANKELMTKITSFQREEEARVQHERRAEEERIEKERKEQEAAIAAQAQRSSITQAADILGIADLLPIDGPETITPLVAPKVIEPPKAIEPAFKSQTATTRKQYKVTITDVSQIPIMVGSVCVRPPDESKILKLLKSGFMIPGCKLDYDEIPVGRG